MSIIKSIQVFVLERRLVKIMGNYKFWSDKIRIWENRLTAYSSKETKISDLDMCKLNGSVRYYTKKVNNWRVEFNKIKTRLHNLGIDVRVEL